MDSFACPYEVPSESKSMEKKTGLGKRLLQSLFGLASGKDEEKEVPSPSTIQTIRKQPSKHILSSSKGKALSEQDKKYLIEKAESYIDSKNLQQALKCYNQLIENSTSHL